MSTERAPIKVLLRAEHSGGAVSEISSGSLPGFGGPPLHHHDFDEAFYVIEGKLTFQLGDELLTRKAESWPSRRGGWRTPTPTRATPPAGT
jgi:mannose-6-phosphate isomerase-like protein (cupin superfamily)